MAKSLQTRRIEKVFGGNRGILPDLPTLPLPNLPIFGLIGQILGAARGALDLVFRAGTAFLPDFAGIADALEEGGLIKRQVAAELREALLETAHQFADAVDPAEALLLLAGALEDTAAVLRKAADTLDDD